MKDSEVFGTAKFIEYDLEGYLICSSFVGVLRQYAIQFFMLLTGLI
jgi:hypothetical protein